MESGNIRVKSPGKVAGKVPGKVAGKVRCPIFTRSVFTRSFRIELRLQIAGMVWTADTAFALRKKGFSVSKQEHCRSTTLLKLLGRKSFM